CLLTYQSSHRPDDLWHFVTPDYKNASMWLQLTSGDNRDMVAVHDSVDSFIAQNPPPLPVAHEWFGLTHINVVWQGKMVVGMLESLAGAFVVVLLLMVVLFRSFLWGFLAMIPLTLTIALVYGAVGMVGKSYDMPVAVLSSLALGLAVDFAIHLLARARRIRRREGSWQAALPELFDEPAREIARNGIVIAVGFLPLLFAPLVPYQTVGFLLAAILAVSGVATLLLLPALVTVLEKALFRGEVCATGEVKDEIADEEKQS
ncbi:MAG TPA: RND transporter, partial [bacterium]|nr:RND transporter [bacterium]